MMVEEKIDRGSVVEEVYDRLRELLLSGDIAPGDRVRISELQSRFGVSHIPIREALRTLESDGLVQSQPQRSSIASPISIQLVDEVYDARRLIEPQVLVRAALNASDQQIGLVRESIAMMEATESDPNTPFFQAHQAFHWALLEPGSTPTLERVVRQLWAMSERFVRISKISHPGDVEAARMQHRHLLELLEARDENIGDLMKEHLHVTQRAIREHYRASGVNE